MNLCFTCVGHDLQSSSKRGGWRDAGAEKWRPAWKWIIEWKTFKISDVGTRVSLPFYMYTRNMTLIWSDSWPTGLNQQYGITFNFFSKHSHSHRRLLLTFVGGHHFRCFLSSLLTFTFYFKLSKGVSIDNVFNNKSTSTEATSQSRTFKVSTAYMYPFSNGNSNLHMPNQLEINTSQLNHFEFWFPFKKKKLIIDWTTSLSISFTLMDWEENGNPKDVALKLAMKNEL